MIVRVWANVPHIILTYTIYTYLLITPLCLLLLLILELHCQVSGYTLLYSIHYNIYIYVVPSSFLFSFFSFFFFPFPSFLPFSSFPSFSPPPKYIKHECMLTAPLSLHLCWYIPYIQFLAYSQKGGKLGGR